MRHTSAVWKRRLWQGLALAACAVLPALLCQLLVEPPQHRYIHVDSFRYGKRPSVIRCNRGDWLHLTFSTQDTAHSFFLEEFDIDAKITPATRNVMLFRTSRPEAPPQIKQEVVFRAEHPGWRRYLVSKNQYRCHVWCGPMHAFEHGNLIIEPNTLLFAGLGLLVGIPLVGLIGLRGELRNGSVNAPRVSQTDGWDVFKRFPWLKRSMKLRGFQFVWIILAAAVLELVLLTTLFGTHVAGRNFGVMVTWVVWLFLLTVFLTPLGGRIWCMACPLPLAGDVLQRWALVGVRRGTTKGYNNRFFGLNLEWPKWLANDWPRLVSFLAFGTFSSALVAHPRFSGWAILGLIVLATAMALVWRLRAFCRYLCPVTGFVGPYSRAGKLALRVVKPEVCADCRVHTCLLGSARGWACPFGLCAADINENTDCGMCTECIKTCAYDNVTLRWRPFAHETAIRSASEAWLVMGMLVVATTYCLVHLGHWPALRDFVNIMDKGNWGLFAVFSAVLWFVALIGLPGLLFGISAVGKRLAGTSQSAFSVLKQCSGALIPIGLMLWVAFVVPMLMVNLTFVLQAISDPFGWGWNLLGAANTPWHQLWPGAIPWIQVLCILVGLRYSLRNAWRIWLGLTEKPVAAIRGMLPISAFLVAYSGYLVWFFAD